MKVILRLATFASAVLLALVWTNPISPAPATASVDAEAFALRVVDLTNEQRAAVGLSQLKWNDALATSAGSFAEYMAAEGFFGHDAPDGTTPVLRARRAGYPSFEWGTYVGENLAEGYDSPEGAMAGWMASDGHRQNLLRPDYADIGVAIAVAPSGTIYYAQEFGKQPVAW